MRIRFLTRQRQMTRRVAGYHDLRLDGISDLLFRSRDASILDIGCNRGLVSFEFANNGAALLHGCDVYEAGVRTARELFADVLGAKSRFEVVDLTGGPAALKKAFSKDYKSKYDIVLFLAVYHKLKRQMSDEKLQKLVQHLGEHAGRYFAWRGAHPEDDEIAPALPQLVLNIDLLRRVA